MRRCVIITKSLRWIGIEVCELPPFDGLGDVEVSFMELESIVLEPKRMLALDAALKATPARWCVAHKNSF